MHPSPYGIIASYARLNPNPDPPPSLVGADSTSALDSINRNRAILDPDINQRLHRLRILLRNQGKQLSYSDEMHEAGVEIRIATGSRPAAQVPEGINPVGVIQVSVEAEHLAEAGLDVAVEALGEASALAEPVAACELGEGRAGGGRSSADRGAGEVLEAAVGAGAAGDVVGWKGLGVVHLAADPALDELDVLGGRDFDGDFLVVEPGVSVASGRC